MVNKVKKKIRKIVLGKRADSDSYVAYLKSIGVKIGEDVTIYVPSKTLIDEQYPWMISIGDHVCISEGVKILTHDYSWSVLKRTCGGILGACGKVNIGNNVFIGMNAIISRGVNIGDNVVIGYGSVVTKDCEPNSVYAGVPAKRLMSIDEYCEKRMSAQKQEAKELALGYYDRFKKKPSQEIFHEYFMLFKNADNYQENHVFSNKLKLCGNEDESIVYMKEHKPIFKDYDEFMRYCFDE